MITKQDELDFAFFKAVWEGNLTAARNAHAAGANPNARDEDTGLPPLHAAVGMNDLLLARYLVDECKVAFGPDHFGRWPTVVAAQCKVSESLGHYIFTKEAAYLDRHDHPSLDVWATSPVV
jgi:hypothetical protein